MGGDVSFSVRAVGLCGAVMLSVAGCSGSVEGAPVVAKRSAAPDMPTSDFDPCTDIPADFLAREKLDALGTPRPFHNKSGPYRWDGCTVGMLGGYAASILTTNLSMDEIRARNYAGYHEFVIDGRTAATYNPYPDHEDSCSLSVEMQSGSLDIGITNDNQATLTGDREACDLAAELAEKIVPMIPEGS